MLRKYIRINDFYVSLHTISKRKINKRYAKKSSHSGVTRKAKRYEKLGKDYKVMSSYGHIRDLKEKEFSIDIEHNYAPKYVIRSRQKSWVAESENEAKNAEMVWLASDGGPRGRSYILAFV